MIFFLLCHSLCRKARSSCGAGSHAVDVDVVHRVVVVPAAKAPAPRRIFPTPPLLRVRIKTPLQDGSSQLQPGERLGLPAHKGETDLSDRWFQTCVSKQGHFFVSFFFSAGMLSLLALAACRASLRNPAPAAAARISRNR